MKKKLAYAVILYSMICLPSYPQVVPSIKCEHFAVDTVKILDKMKEHRYLSNEDSSRFVLIYPLELIPDTLNNQVHYTINKDEPLVYFPFIKVSPSNCVCHSSELKETRFYQYNRIYDSMLLRINKNSFYKAIELSLSRKIDCIYTLKLYPSTIIEGISQYQMIFYRTIDGQEYVFDEGYNYFNNLDEMLEYKFGSVENYIETYKKRIAWHSQKSKERRKYHTGGIKGSND
ncbi:hypothetical protein [Viscerimonas tarda]